MHYWEINWLRVGVDRWINKVRLQWNRHVRKGHYYTYRIKHLLKHEIRHGKIPQSISEFGNPKWKCHWNLDILGLTLPLLEWVISFKSVNVILWRDPIKPLLSSVLSYGAIRFSAFKKKIKFWNIVDLGHFCDWKAGSLLHYLGPYLETFPGLPLCEALLRMAVLLWPHTFLITKAPEFAPCFRESIFKKTFFRSFYKILWRAKNVH